MAPWLACCLFGLQCLNTLSIVQANPSIKSVVTNQGLEEIDGDRGLGIICPGSAVRRRKLMLSHVYKQKLVFVWWCNMPCDKHARNPPITTAVLTSTAVVLPLFTKRFNFGSFPKRFARIPVLLRTICKLSQAFPFNCWNLVRPYVDNYPVGPANFPFSS